ncbi:hypothetical protein MNEG_2672 [Monoraphidium neglectum]|uniref:tRNA-binding domain-containing protein n=1 Tax=Monoraphidium neglectum TaxID=145388 RepID=A0A0D2K4C9_9CHLO|nr:hypothetical protein MNEG_2672 [Monoraphidium neglectum]KIZ05283.1 hypothetical protein MNEG_2672 [Monoraphidium neglectum]|eukprot:XP_013904302.1 hypothetical protein MNEG_2672 [Monoraphidium neglectum]
MALTVGDDALGRAVLLISAATGDPLGKPAQGASTSAQTSEGIVTGLAACATALAAKSQSAADLLGRTPLEQAQVSEWLTWCTTELALLLDDKLAKVNEQLQARTYLVGSRLTLADLAVFGTVQPAVAALPLAQTDQFCSLLRWFDLIQHQADPQQAVFKHTQLQLPRFVPPPPPAAPAPSAAGAASSSGKGDSAKGSDASAATKAAPAASSSKAAPPAAAPKPAASPAAAAAQDAAAAAAAPAAGGKEKKAKKEKGGGGGGDGAAAPAAAAAGGKKGGGDDEVRIDMLDIVVGQIVKVGKHPNADSLYLEEIDVGEDKPRQVISGLVKFVPEEKMQGRRVVVVLNLKPAKMRDVMSYGMVLCASNDAHDQVDPIIPPEGVPLGERVAFEGYANAPLPEVNPKKKILEKLLPDLTTDASGNPVFKGVPFMTSKGPVTSTIPNAHVG